MASTSALMWLKLWVYLSVDSKVTEILALLKSTFKDLPRQLKI
ncbi:hypothetical protein ALT785_770114 [Alteromonas infernus]